ncbi:uncharacterized protein LOC142578506 [Dermacentor variabilis]|uniref:uncharacterized protein LOC142578506 n=1 Tax=Dermacentor variabilis TaxID=34621 RepID=UPI003F5C3F95
MKLDSLTTTVSTLMVKIEELLLVREASEKVASAVEAIRSTIDFLSSKYDSVLATVATNQNELADLRSQVQSLSSTVVSQTQVIDRMSGEINDLEQYGRRCNFEIHGLPVKSDENLLFLKYFSRQAKHKRFSTSRYLGSASAAIQRRLYSTNSSANSLNFYYLDTLSKWGLETKIHSPTREEYLSGQLVSSCIDHINVRSQNLLYHRVPSKDKNKPNVIIKFSTRSARDRVLSAARTAKLSTGTLGFEESNPRLLGRARQLRREKEWKFVWVSQGKILMRKSENSPVLHVTCDSDLDKSAFVPMFAKEVSDGLEGWGIQITESLVRDLVGPRC